VDFDAVGARFARAPPAWQKSRIVVFISSMLSALGVGDSCMPFVVCIFCPGAIADGATGWQR
jgi:hypothetical protein